ncbi:MAG TPA: family 43 glycosylhydrolase, partial [Polyangia bacterium]
MRTAGILTLALLAASGCGGERARPADAGAGDGDGFGANDGGGGDAATDGGAGAADLAPGGDMTPPCTTRIDYGSAWIHPAGHASSFDVTDGVVTWDRTCHDDGANSYAQLSNGWKPYFTGNGACSLTLDYGSCGVYANPVIPQGCADPGVVRDGSRWIVACTSGNAADAFPLRVSTDLVHWKAMGSILPSAAKPAWAVSDFWAPEIHRVGAQWVAYFTARGSDGKLAIGTATAPSATGPFTAQASPIVHDANMGLIDATELEASDGTKYLLWKEDGNAVGKPTPIHGQPL